jgi:hypothetical protein
MLKSLVDDNRTDKNTAHSYLDLYETLLSKKKNTATNVLEVGIGDGNAPGGNGGSIMLWHNYFQNATVHALDVQDINKIWDELKNKNRIQLYTSINAYDESKFKEYFLDKNIKCDFMLDDGPHTLNSMIDFIRLYSQIMTDDGILIIEDVQELEWIDILKSQVPESLKQYVKTYDLRANKGRHDDIVFTIDKSSAL